MHHEHVDLRHQGLVHLLVGGNLGTVGKAPAFDDPRKTGLLLTHLGDQRHPFSAVHLKHCLEIREARGEPAFLYGVDIVHICDQFWRSLVAGRVSLSVCQGQGALAGLSVGFGMNPLKPGCW